jgi:hypothetical protein
MEKLLEGFWNGATIVQVSRVINEDPAVCYSKARLTKVYTSFTSLTIQKNCKEKITCFGSGKVEFYPGLRSKGA